ncbi:MAG: hypothetical protein JXX14_00505 [Deltaproteobacteria bacterium]|nr:hypothetical protein [Deltaproteobacteria bacterium]
MDDTGAHIRVSGDVAGREGSVQVMALDHLVQIPVNPGTGALSGIDTPRNAVGDTNTVGDANVDSSPIYGTDSDSVDGADTNTGTGTDPVESISRPICQ